MMQKEEVSRTGSQLSSCQAEPTGSSGARIITEMHSLEAGDQLFVSLTWSDLWKGVVALQVRRPPFHLREGQLRDVLSQHSQLEDRCTCAEGDLEGHPWPLL